MYSHLGKFLLPLFVLLSYVVTPVLAQDETGEVKSMHEEVTEVSDGLCAVDAKYFKDHPTVAKLTQGQLLVKGTEVDLSSTLLKQIPKDANCSQQLFVGADDCVVCRNMAESEWKGIDLSAPQKFLNARSSINICPKGPGTCTTKVLEMFDLPGGSSLRCEFADKGQGPPRRPFAEAMATSPLLALGVKVRVDCQLLKPTPGQPFHP
jgi:hypothetical protein